MSTERKTADERRSLLSRQIGSRLASGRRVESQSEFQAVLIHGHAVNHILHLFISIITAGIWIIVWIALVIFGGERREIVEVDEWGNSSVSKL